MNPLLLGRRRMVVGAIWVFILLLGFVSTANAQSPDLRVDKSTLSSFVPANTDVSYEIIVSNFSGAPSSGQVTLTDNVPANMTFVSASAPDGWSCTTPSVGGTGTITCTFDASIPDESVFPFFFVFHVNPAVENNTVIINTASITNDSDTNSENNSSSAAVTVGEPPPVPTPLAPGDVLISEFRLSGPGGSEDDFIELYCNRDTDCDISNASLRAYDPVNGGDFSISFPGQTFIPARQYLLAADSRGYTLSSYGYPDFDVFNPAQDPTFYFYDNQGFQLVGGDEAIVIDSVGFTGGGNQESYIEGTGLQPSGGITPSRPADQYAYVRKRGTATNGIPQDTNNNADDFVLVSVTGAFHPGITTPPVLGAPGPQGLFSPLSYSNSQVAPGLTDPGKSKEEDPNRVRVGEGDSGTLSIRRSLTNNTGDTFSYLGFRVIDMTTLNSPNTLGNQAELRLISSSETSADVPSRGGIIPIFGTVLEYDNTLCGCEPQQPNGGGLNSSVFAEMSEGSVEPGQTVDVQLLLNVVKSGAYRFYVSVEAGPIRGGQVITTQKSTSTSGPLRGGATPTTPRTFVDAKRLNRPVAVGKKPKTRTSVGTKSDVNPGFSGPSFMPPRVFIIHRGAADPEKKPRRKMRLKKKRAVALKKITEEKYGAEKPQN